MKYKYAKVFLSIMAALILLGCGTAKTQSKATATSSSKSARSSSASQAQVAVNSQQSTGISLQWIGVDADKLSPNDLSADGNPDGHFHITLPLNEPALIKSIWIRYSEFGKSYKWGWVYNKNLPSAGYKMAVFDDMGQAILSQGDNGYRAEGITNFDLFISELNFENERDTLKFEKGQSFTAEVDYITQDNKEKEFDGSVTIT